MTFIRPLSVDDPAIGGKARSLARLAALGLSTPAGFAIDAELSRALRAAGPALPTRLHSHADVTTLEAVRDALLAAHLPEDFQRELAAALAMLDPTADPNVTFAVRSSAANEDSAAAAAPGIFDSCVRVRRAEVAEAVKTVLASALSPAAWTYALRQAAPSTELAVLVHAFVEATSHGAAAGAANGDPTSVTVAAEQGEPTAEARACIQHAVTAATMRFGASELEWAAQVDEVTFLQLRPFRATPLAAQQRKAAGEPTTDDGWSWDAAHNPTPLSPAQAGLVALVDERCRTGLRQQVRQGYLFFARDPARATPSATDAADAHDSTRVLLERLSAQVDARLDALDDPPRVEAALEVYVAAYTPLFGAIQPACSEARARLKLFLADAFPDQTAVGLDLTAGVVSAATRRASLTRAITDARESSAQKAALDAYLQSFGDESPRWDVAEPTYREAPERLLFLGSAGPAPRAPTVAPHQTIAAALATRLPESRREAFHDVLAAAREAVAVGEDDDHLFARLQAVVRRALLALGQRLVAAGRLPAVDDVFFLPLPVVRALDDARLLPSLVPGGAASLDLPSLAIEGRRAFAAASTAAPPLARAHAATAGLVIGIPGSPGRVLGRAVHHPSSAPLRTDAILIAVTLLPTELPLLTPAALVVETGTALGHVAAQARERGIPAVVSARGARAAIREGQLIIVDGTRGQIALVDAPP